jgi:hypothetical protein
MQCFCIPFDADLAFDFSHCPSTNRVLNPLTKTVWNNETKNSNSHFF